MRAAFEACPELTAGDHRPMPYARFWLDGAPGSVSTVERGASPMGKLLLMPVKGPTTRRIYPPKVFPKVATPEALHDDLREPLVARQRRARAAARRPPS